MKKIGYLYFLINQSMPGLIKIGYTYNSVDERIQELNTSGVPSPFTLGACYLVNNAKQCELTLHKAFHQNRLNKKREFFKMDLFEAIDKSIPIIKKYIIENTQDALNKIRNDEEKQFLDEVDDLEIYFMQIILHDSYALKEPITTEKLAESQSTFHPIELEDKLLHLSEKGLIQQIQQRNEILSSWKMTSVGIRFMMENKHLLQDLIDEDKKLGF